MGWPIPVACVCANAGRAATTALRRAVVEGVEQLKTMSFEASPPPPMQEALLEWNSWARAQNLLEANFGTNIRTFEWVCGLRPSGLCHRMHEAL